MSGISDSQNRDEEEACIAGSKNDLAAAASCVDVLGIIAPALLVGKNVSAVSQQPEQKPLCGIEKNASSKKATADTGDGKTDGEDLKSTMEKHGCKESPENTVEKHGVRVRVRVRVGLGSGRNDRKAQSAGTPPPTAGCC